MSKDGKVYKLTPKQLAFAQAIVYGIEGQPVDQSTAYRHAYSTENMNDVTIWKRSGELMQHGAVKGWVDKQRSKLLERNEVTVDSLITECNDAMALARETKQTGAMVSAIQLKSKLSGLLVEKRETEATIKHEKSEAPDVGKILEKHRTHTAPPQSDTEAMDQVMEDWSAKAAELAAKRGGVTVKH